MTRLGKWNEEVGTPSIRESLLSKGPAQALVFFVEKVVESCLKVLGRRWARGTKQYEEWGWLGGASASWAVAEDSLVSRGEGGASVWYGFFGGIRTG